MNNQQSPKWQNLMKRLIVIMIGVVCLVCLVGVGYFTVYRWIDQAICYSRVGKMIDVNPDYLSIRSYIQSNLTPGMSRQEVISMLETVGPVIQGTTNSDEVWVNICSNPLNNIVLFTNYSQDGKLDSVKFDDE
jgi:hypothetical protein